MASIPIRFRVFENPDSACAQVAAEISQLIRERAILGRQVVIGLVTGRTPEPLYQELIYLYREEGLSFKNVIAFVLSEYVGVNEEEPQSAHSFMQRTFFDHVDIPYGNIHFLRGDVAPSMAAEHCQAYEALISEAGGIDLQILGIGRNGHIGFNEPETPMDSRTSQVELAETTREDAIADFGTLGCVPTHGLTLGCGTILEARRIILMAWGNRKARVARRTIQGPVTTRFPASFLLTHLSTQVFLDQAAAVQLTSPK